MSCVLFKLNIIKHLIFNELNRNLVIAHIKISKKFLDINKK